jgi:hypothetical protein
MSLTNLRLHSKSPLEHLVPTHDFFSSVSGAYDLPHTLLSKPLKTFVEIEVNGLRQHTKTVSQGSNPSWNEDFQL